ncbi:GDSL-type esterase/lipase family protein [Methylobacterium sp. J-077]|uniref:GDSL-type esterase/lipase family protein n=1 Tax=Methylobacterium sp. J-077 TaxID=2836656 RepID=UPI001FBA1090|nr:GDSL-type esterase/lipase family protein [Methylobacterium sp. J-077]MCJ2121790.1 GDSL-type esterase/lipase family protein [Methylobacterium sp. J-077]
MGKYDDRCDTTTIISLLKRGRTFRDLPMRICFIGDSFVNGTGDDDCLGWPGRLCAEARSRGYDITLYNLGIRRDTSGDVARRWEREAAARLPVELDGRLVFSFGVNDCVLDRGLPRILEEETLANARRILERARTTWPTLMVGPPCAGEAALDERVSRLSGRLDALCRVLSVPYLPIFPRLAGAEVWRMEARRGDGIHPNRGGYTLLHQAVLDWPPWRDWVT